MTDEFKLSFYLIYRRLVLVSYLIFLLLAKLGAFDHVGINIGFFVIMMFPVVVPFLYSLIFSEKGYPLHFYIHLACLGSFLLIAATSDKFLASVFLMVLLAASFITYLMVESTAEALPKGEKIIEKKPKPVTGIFEPEAHVLKSVGPEMDLVEETTPEPHFLERIEVERDHGPGIEEKIKLKIREVKGKIDQYQEQLTRLNREKGKRENYLKDVEKRLASDHLSEQNREISLQLKESLTNSLTNYELLVQFFSEAKALFVKEKKNLQDTLGNLEIIKFLQKDSPLDKVSEVEKTMLQMEFEKHIKEIEQEIPILTDRMLADSIDLSQDKKRQLEEAILKLK